MVARSFGRFTAKVMGGAKATAAGQRAADYGARLRAEYEAGKRGDAPDPASDAGAEAPTGAAEEEAAAEAAADAADVQVADDVATAMRRVDWSRVKAATAGSTAAATTKVRSMAAEVDWEKVQPVAAQVSSALIAAVASGQIPLGGRLGTQVARTIMNDHDLARQVATVLARTPQQQPPDFRPLIATAIDHGVIDTTAVEEPPPSASGGSEAAQPNT